MYKQLKRNIIAVQHKYITASCISLCKSYIALAFFNTPAEKLLYNIKQWAFYSQIPKKNVQKINVQQYARE